MQKFFFSQKKYAYFHYLSCDLPHTVNKLKKYGTAIVGVVCVFKVTVPMSKLVAKTQPLFLNENNESFQGTVVGVQH